MSTNTSTNVNNDNIEHDINIVKNMVQSKEDIIKKYSTQDNRSKEEINNIIKVAKIRVEDDFMLKFQQRSHAKYFKEQLFDKKLCMPTMKLKNEDDTEITIMNIIKKGVDFTLVNDIVEPFNPNSKAIFIINELFNSQYICFLRGREIYYNNFTNSQILEILTHYRANNFNNLNLSKSDLLNAAIQYICRANKNKKDTADIFENLCLYDIIEIDNLDEIYDYEYNKFLDLIRLEKIKGTDTQNISNKIESNPISCQNNKLKELFKDYAVLDNRGSLKIIKSSEKEFIYYTKSSLEMKFAKEIIIDNTGKRINAAKAWLESNTRKDYEGVSFDPSNPNELNNGTILNLYKGRAYKAKDMIDISFFKEFVYEIICSNDLLYFYIVWSFFAQLIQEPKTKVGLVLTLLSPQGTGKSVFINTMGKLFGDYFLQTSKQSDLTGNFNKQLMHCLLLYANEQSFTSAKAMDKLKNIATEVNRTYEPKFIDSFKDVNYTRVIIDSNREHAIDHQILERRLFYPKISNKRQGDIDYFSELQNKIEKNGFHESLQYDLENFNYIPLLKYMRVPPKNDVLMQQLGYSLNSTYKWLVYCLEEAMIPHVEYSIDIDGRLKVLKDNLFLSYKQYCNNSNIKLEYDRDRFHQSWKNIITNNDLYKEKKITVDRKTKKRKRVIIFNLRDSLAEHVNKATKSNIIKSNKTQWQRYIP